MASQKTPDSVPKFFEVQMTTNHDVDDRHWPEHVELCTDTVSQIFQFTDSLCVPFSRCFVMLEALFASVVSYKSLIFATFSSI